MRLERTNTLTIQTPEGISFSLILAGPMSRFLAWLIDLGCIAVLSKLINMLTSVMVVFSRDMGTAMALFAYFVVSIGYGIVTEWFWYGQTLGKRLLRLRVLDEQGLRLQFSQVAIRNLLRFVDSLPGLYLVGGLACLVSRRSQRLGDMAANTIVVRTPKIKAPDLSQLLGDKFNSLRDYPHLAARLRQKAGVSDAGVALRAILRRDAMAPDARIRLFQEIADHFKAIVPFPDDAVLGISDEQYVRNVVDILYRTG